MKSFQIAIIGGGIIGSAIARELSKYKLKVAVFEKGSDVASGSSKANSGVIHSGINSKVNSLKAKFCVQGNEIIKNLANDLGFSAKWVGKYVVAKNENELKELKRLKEVGIKNGVYGLKIIDRKDIKKNEFNASCYEALWVPTAGIVLPYEFTIALAENAAINGVDFFLETEVIDIKKEENHFEIKTINGIFKSDIIINAAGLNCRKIVSMLEEPDFNIYPCRGEYLVLDKNYSNLLTSMIYPIPDKESGVLGIHITPTIEGNILLGPSAEFIEDLEDTRTTNFVTKNLLKEARKIMPALPKNAVINAYSGIRCKLASKKQGGWADYRIEESKNTPGLINLLGIESPGLTAAPAIAKEVVRIISGKIKLEEKTKFISKVKKEKRFSELTAKKQDDLIKQNPRYGRIICRCEHITEQEVIQALSNPLGAKTLSSVKYRCRAGMGRCQGGFCTQHVVRILEDHFKVKPEEMKLKSPGSYLFSKNMEKSYEKS